MTVQLPRMARDGMLEPIAPRERDQPQRQRQARSAAAAGHSDAVVERTQRLRRDGETDRGCSGERGIRRTPTPSGFCDRLEPPVCRLADVLVRLCARLLRNLDVCSQCT
eukprot:jgi/Chrpa1/302/Chrysochromulina_OHIO_Genome00014681-RA